MTDDKKQDRPDFDVESFKLPDGDKALRVEDAEK